MITLDFMPEQQAVIEQASKRSGMDIAEFIQQNAYQNALMLMDLPTQTMAHQPINDGELDFYTMWQDRFSDTDDIEQQQQEVNAVLADIRKGRNFDTV